MIFLPSTLTNNSSGAKNFSKKTIVGKIQSSWANNVRATLSSSRTSLRRSIERQQTAPIIFHRSRGDRVFEM